MIGIPVSDQANRKLPGKLLRWAAGALVALALSLMAAGSGPAQDSGVDTSRSTEGLVQEPYQPMTQPHPEIENPVPDDRSEQKRLESQPPLQHDPDEVQPAEQPTPAW